MASCRPSVYHSAFTTLSITMGSIHGFGLVLSDPSGWVATGGKAGDDKGHRRDGDEICFHGSILRREHTK